MLGKGIGGLSLNARKNVVNEEADNLRVFERKRIDDVDRQLACMKYCLVESLLFYLEFMLNYLWSKISLYTIPNHQAQLQNRAMVPIKCLIKL